MNTFAAKIIELYEKYKIDDAHIRLSLRDIDVPNVSQMPLESFREPSSWPWYFEQQFVALFGNLPPAVLHQEFGQRTLLWTWIRRCKLFCGNSGMSDYVYEMIGGDFPQIDKARNYVTYDKATGCDVGAFLKNLDVFNSVKSIQPEDVGLAGILKKCAKDGVAISDKRRGDYGLIGLSTVGSATYGYDSKYAGCNDSGLNYDIYLDAPVGLCLTYKSRPNALVSFGATDAGILKIEQMQGVNPKNGLKQNVSARGLMPFDWHRLMAEIAIGYAKSEGFSKVCIQSGHNNAWVPTHLSIEKALKIYDNTAERLGFAQEDGRDWYLGI